ncbi:MAG: TIGR00288 family NYN domain-containing protein [Candidatus Micrarchaeota archaeon]|nr:TIGR00288 family NYN domain-containing protein [Candidatus Micrarchaeota archaeon]
MQKFAVFDKIKNFIKLPSKKPEKNIALMVDGPNIIRKEFKLDLTKVKQKLERFGHIKVAKVFLDQYASDKLIEAVTNQGFEPIISTGDVDVTMAVESICQVYNPNIDIIALMTRDIDFRPVILKAKEFGKQTIVIGAEPGFSVALKNTADYIILIDEQ